MKELSDEELINEFHRAVRSVCSGNMNNVGVVSRYKTKLLSLLSEDGKAVEENKVLKCDKGHLESLINTLEGENKRLKETLSSGFEEWLRTVCFQKPTPEAYDLARDAWKEARKTNLEEIENLKDEIDTLKKKSVCVYCGHIQISEKVEDKMNDMIEHMAVCENHPVVKLLGIIQKLVC